MTRVDWINQKQQIAERLARGECEGSYAEAILILCSALSALSAEVWTGQGIDQKRFIELLVEYASPELYANRISIPLLFESLCERDRTTADIIRARFLSFNPGRILTGDQVDRTEDEILRIPVTIARKTLREFSYANLLYREVRSAYVHEYRSGSRSSPWAMSSLAPFVSYVNWVGDSHRQIHFGVDWISNLARSVARDIDVKGPTLPLPPPSRWWVEG